VRYERAVGWIAHYVVGVIYAALYLALVWFVLGTGPTQSTAVGFGAVTVIAPWFLMQPGMGLGVLARRAPSGRRSRPWSVEPRCVWRWPLWGEPDLMTPGTNRGRCAFLLKAGVQDPPKDTRDE
jgi:hypothetical protein